MSSQRRGRPAEILPLTGTFYLHIRPVLAVPYNKAIHLYKLQTRSVAIYLLSSSTAGKTARGEGPFLTPLDQPIALVSPGTIHPLGPQGLEMTVKSNNPRMPTVRGSRLQDRVIRFAFE